MSGIPFPAMLVPPAPEPNRNRNRLTFIEWCGIAGIAFLIAGIVIVVLTRPGFLPSDPATVAAPAPQPKTTVTYSRSIGGTDSATATNTGTQIHQSGGEVGAKNLDLHTNQAALDDVGGAGGSGASGDFFAKMPSGWKLWARLIFAGLAGLFGFLAYLNFSKPVKDIHHIVGDGIGCVLSIVGVVDPVVGIFTVGAGVLIAILMRFGPKVAQAKLESASKTLLDFIDSNPAVSAAWHSFSNDTVDANGARKATVVPATDKATIAALSRDNQ